MKIKEPKINNVLEESDINENNYYEDKSYKNQTVEKMIEKREFNACTFEKIDFNENIENVDFIDCIFKGCDLSNIKLTTNLILRCKFINCKLMGVFFDRISIKDVVFENCNLEYSILASSSLENVQFDMCTLKEGRLFEIKHKNLFFDTCNLTEIEIIDTSLRNIDLSTSEIGNIRVSKNNIEGLIIRDIQLLEIASLFGVEIKND